MNQPSACPISVPLADDQGGRAGVGLDQPRSPLPSCRSRRGQPPIRDERSDTIIAGRGASRNDVRYGTPPDRDTHLLTPLDRSLYLAQRTLQVADTDLAHDRVTLPAANQLQRLISPAG